MKTKTNAFSRFALAACFLLSGSFISPIAAQEASGDNQDATIKIMTYNTKSGKLAGGMGEICNIIRAEEPDFAVLQEIERNTSDNPGDIPMIMAEELGMDYYLFIHAKNIKEGGDYGNVILSKYPILDYRTYKLGRKENNDNIRSFGFILTEKEGKKFYVATTLLDHQESDATRENQVKELLLFVSSLEYPILLGGDMNSRPGSAIMDKLKEKFTVEFTGENAPATVIPEEGEAYTSDWIIYSPANAFSVESYEAVTSAQGKAEHLPIVATYTIH